jgi:hypothetical protein
MKRRPASVARARAGLEVCLRAVGGQLLASARQELEEERETGVGAETSMAHALHDGVGATAFYTSKARQASEVKANIKSSQ